MLIWAKTKIEKKLGQRKLNKIEKKSGNVQKREPEIKAVNK